MTRSPVPASDAQSHLSGRQKSNRNDALGQRQRLRRDVMRRQQQHGESSVSATTNDNEAARQDQQQNNNSENRQQQQQQRMTAVEVPVVPTLTPEQMYSNFEEWIKMCTDNKVNATNSWNFALIDYFHEMTFIRDGDSINFQKASCTLDGCVKIYTSRVDSVASETGKLLSGLADSAAANTTDDADEDDDYQRSERAERRSRRRGNKAELTLLKDFSSIAVKKFDLDFAVDPLFKKTSADFDEGGARGLLLNHLSIDKDCKIVFDASDASFADLAMEEKSNDDDMPPDDEQQAESDNENGEDAMSIDGEEENKEGEQSEQAQDKAEQPATENDPDHQDIEMENATEQNKTAQENETVDIYATRPQVDKNSLVEISRLKAKLPPMRILSELHICPTLQGYNFFSESDLRLPDLDHHDSNEIHENHVENEAARQDNDNNDYDTGHDPFDYDMDPIFDYDDGPVLDGIDDDDHHQGTAEQEPVLGFQEEEFLNAFTSNADNELFSYFDSAFAKNWAGPEHWKLRRTALPKDKEKDNTTQNNEQDDERPRRNKARPAFEINFFDEEEVDEDELFATDKRAKITMPVPKDSHNNANKNNLHLLPDDFHFSSKQLLRLFLKPKYSIKNRKKPSSRETTEHEGTESESPHPAEQPDFDTGFEPDFDIEPDAEYWAQQATQQTQQNEGGETARENAAADQTVLTGIDDTSFYQDTFIDPYYDPENSYLYGDSLITNHRLKKTRPLYVNYAKVAKRVDVKKLKENLWKVLTATQTTSSSSSAYANSDTVQGEKRFTDIIQDLHKLYTPKAMKDISVPFCFICLLHLANEKNLTISRGNTQDDDFVLGDNDALNENLLNEVTIVQNV